MVLGSKGEREVILLTYSVRKNTLTLKCTQNAGEIQDSEQFPNVSHVDRLTSAQPTSIPFR